MDEQARARLESAAADLDLPLDQARPLVLEYYAAVGPDDVLARTPAELASVVARHLAVGRVRAPGTACVGLEGPATVDVVTDDMPFLVDSVVGALVGAGHDIALLVHPQFTVRRTPEGVLEGIAAEGTPESWIHVELGPLTADEPAALQGRLEEVLADVRAAVVDWPAMRDQALALANELAASPPVGIDPAEVRDGVELLRWLADDNFTFTGYREYMLEASGGEDVLVAVPGTALGVMRAEHRESSSFARLSPEARRIALEPHLLVLTKGNRRSNVHRPVYLDYVGVKKVDSAGRVVGEHRFMGLYAATTYSQSVLEIPVVRRKVEQVVAQSGARPDSHDMRDLMQLLETYPRDELLEIHVERLAEITEQVLHLQERRVTQGFMRYDDFGRFVSVLVYLPRDRYTTEVRERMQAVLADVFGAESVDFTARVTESVLARLHFLVRVGSDRPLPHVDENDLDRLLADAATSWEDRLESLIAAAHGPQEAAAALERFADSFPESYKEDFTAEDAVRDLGILASLEAEGAMAVRLYQPGGAADLERRFAVYLRGAGLSLSEILPVLQSLGVGVVDERPYEIDDTMGRAWVYDFGLVLPAAGDGGLAERFEAAFLALWADRLDRDGLATLVTAAGLHWRQVALVQTLMEYARQLGSPFSRQYSQGVLVAHGRIVRDIVALFEGRLDPDGPRGEGEEPLLESVREQLDAIASLDEDRIVRSLLGVVLAVVRTSYYQVAADGQASDVIAVKVLPAMIPEAPRPRPEFEVWVHSPRVSGVHLRFGAVARGGLRWSDRREDFRTEVLGLVKAQMVKNAVIVPVGAKGGFVCLRPVDPADREAFLAEGVACYQLFISALLDVTDNLVSGAVVPPERVVRRDGDDPYLVVAADKGTATFSDIANSIALARGFWLGDAFASGGSAGYDHKAMGITARGAWESVKRHFRSLGIDVQTQDTTVVGVGDMSGDVFGNGMLLSQHIRLVAAFDHRHIFLDPNPDAATSFVERQRLFDLPRSSWADYNTALLSPGGGVHARSAKSIPITPEVAARLGLDPEVTAMAPNDLLHAILTAPVDLLWNGGIGTYVKAVSQSNLDVGDKANDAIRIDGAQLRCRVVGEGGNLGFTQLGRIEASLAGVLINTDAIDNSAGVDTSDHEVNIKILLDAAVRDQSLAADEREPFLESMTHDVAAHVLRDNYEQNLALAVDLAQSGMRLPVHRRLLLELEDSVALDRGLEGLPSDLDLERRSALGTGLVSPEMCVLMAWVKIGLTASLAPSRLADEPWFGRLLREYFPEPLVQRFGDRLAAHPLANDIVTMMVSNKMVNRGGITYPFRVAEETGATPAELARAYRVAIEVFGLEDLWRRIESLDDVAPMAVQTALLQETRRLLDRATRWVLQTRGHTVDVDAEVAVLRPVVARLAPKVPGMLRGTEAQRLAINTAGFTEAGAPEALAADVAALLDVFSLLDVVDVARRLDQDPEQVAALYFDVSERYGGDVLLRRITVLPRPDRWATLARAALRSDLYTALAALTARVGRGTAAGTPPDERIERWEAGQPEGVTRARGTLEEIAALEECDIATLSVALRVLRSLVAQGGQVAVGDS